MSAETLQEQRRRDASDSRVFWHPRCADIDRATWERLFGASRQGLFWFKALEAGTGRQFAFWYGLLRRGTTIAGIVPAFLFDVPLKLILPPRERKMLDFVARGPLRRARCMRTLFIGNVAGEEGAIGLDEDLERENVYTVIHDAARTKATELGASMLVWKDFPESERTALDRLIEARAVFRLPSYPATVIPIRRGGYAAFLAEQTASRRYKIKRKLALGEASTPAHVRTVDFPVASELAVLFKLFQQTYARGTTQFELLTPDFFREIAAAEESTFLVMSDPATERPIAFMLLLDLGERIINQFVGIDYSLGRQAFLSFRLFASAYDWAAQRGGSVMCSGQTGYSSKLDLGHQLVPLWNYCRHSNPLVNWALSRGASRIRWEALDTQLRIHYDAHRARYEPRNGVRTP